MNKKEKPNRLYLRVSDRDKGRITALAKDCGLSAAEYIRRRALDYKPGAVLPDAFFVLFEKLDALTEKPFSPEVNAAALALMSDMEKLIAPGKETQWPPQASGR